MLQALIGADWNIVEDLALFGVVDRAVERVAAEAAADRSHQNSFRIEALEQNAEALVDFADNVLRPQIDVVEKPLPLRFRRRDADRDILFLHALGLEIDDEQGETVGLLFDLGMRYRP